MKKLMKKSFIKLTEVIDKTLKWESNLEPSASQVGSLPIQLCLPPMREAAHL